MELTKILRVGERITIKIGEHSFKATLQDFISNDKFLVEELFMSGIPIRIPLNTVVKIICFRPDCTYRFSAEQNGMFIENNIRMQIFMAHSEPKRHQMRSHYRLPVVLDLLVASPENPEDIISDIECAKIGDSQIKPLEPEQMHFATKTMDICEGGLSFLAEHVYKNNTKLALKLSISNHDEILAIESEVVRCSCINEAKQTYIVSVKYIDCPISIQRIIGKYIMAEQIKRRKIL